MNAATPHFAPPRHLTKTELALELLRERIHSGELAPGQRLELEELTQLLGMSATPIREALRLLQADRLVNYHPHHGVVVTEPPPEVTAAARTREHIASDAETLVDRPEQPLPA